MSGPFLPDSVRPRAPRRRGRQPLAFLLAAVALPLLAPWWRLRTVEVTTCDGLPSSAVSALYGLEGQFALAVDPQRLAAGLEEWPAVAEVDVRLSLPGTLEVRATPVLPHGSVAVGRGFRAVAEDGRLAGPLKGACEPVLEGFPRDPPGLGKGLEIARRLGSTSGLEVRTVRLITPTDYEVRLESGRGGRVFTVWVGAAASAAERYWCRRLAHGDEAVGWVDLRQEDRVVVGGER